MLGNGPATKVVTSMMTAAPRALARTPPEGSKAQAKRYGEVTAKKSWSRLIAATPASCGAVRWVEVQR